MKRRVIAGLALVGLLASVLAIWVSWQPRVPVVRPISGEATVEFLDVGQGDAALIRSPEGKTALIDAGPSQGVVALLRDRQVERLDLVIVSHHHIDHYGGMKEVIRQFHPRVFVDADSPHVTPSYLALLQLVRDEGIIAIRAGPVARKVELGSITLTLFPQSPTNDRNENNNSVGVRLQYGQFSALFPGDAEGSERRWWMEHVPELCEGVDVLKLAHHGSRNGTDGAWLTLTRPELAIASLAAGNEFGHPHRETLRLLQSRSIPLLRTDQSGSIAIRTDGLTWSIEEARQAVAGR